MTQQDGYNTQYVLGHILEPLMLAVIPDVHKSDSRRLSVHIDTCRVHRSKAFENCFAENSIIRVPLPPYSSNLEPSDFWIFGRTKAALAGQQFPGAEDPLIGIQEFLSEIQRSELELVFHDWIERVQCALDNNEDSVHE
jgi:hypothetical protein